MNNPSRVTVPRKVRALGFALAMLAVVAIPAGDRVSGDDARAEGADLYRVYCSSCHGIAGRGDGPTATYLTIEPPDLTRLAGTNGGVFPAERVRRAIDGRETLRGHGTREMPIWGLAFQEWNLDVNQEAEVRRKIDRLVVYLESIQVAEDE